MLDFVFNFGAAADWGRTQVPQQGGHFPPCHAVLRAYITMTRLINLITLPFLLISSLCPLSDTLKVMWMFMKSFQYNLYKGKYYWGRISLKSSVSNPNWNQLLLGVRYTCFHGRKMVVLLGCVFLRGFLPLFRQGWEGKTVVLVCILLLPY